MATETTRKGQVVRRTGPGGRDYLWEPTGERFPSVTTLISGLDKPALPYWAADETAQEAVSQFGVLSEFLRDDEEHVPDPAAAIEWLKRAPWRRSEKAAAMGTAIHALIESLVTGAPKPAPTAAEEPYMRSFLAFCDDHDPEFHMAEAPVFSRSEKYAGTLDAVATLRKGPHAGGPYLVDYKTHSKSLADLAAKGKPGPPYPEIGLQMAAYKHAEFVGVVQDGSEQPMPETASHGIAVVLFADGYKVVRVYCGDEVFTAFRYAREAYRWKAVTSKSVLGESLTVGVV